MSDNPAPLLQQVADAKHRALADGSLYPIATRVESITDEGQRFVVRIVEHLADKPRPRPAARHDNPFLPYDPAMFVADISPTHVALLNKFMVVDNHLLIVTREFESQTLPLTVADFDALARCMSTYESLGFYNSGTLAGASQPHRHLQLVPLNTRVTRQSFPLLLTWKNDLSLSLPFRHRFVSFAADPFLDLSTAGDYLHQAYRSLLAMLDAQPEADLPPYNLLVTRGGMLLVPRTQEMAAEVSLNAMAYAGALLVHRPEQLEALRRFGLARALRVTSGAE